MERLFGHPFSFILFALPVSSPYVEPISSDESEAWFDVWSIIPI